MKKIAILVITTGFLFNIYSQWQSAWTTSTINDAALTGWFSFEKSNNVWLKRFYLVDSLKFQVMTSQYSTTPQYTYTFNAAERFAGGLIYSLATDLNGDNKTEFYIMSYYGTTTNYRSAFKIFDITTGLTIFEKNDANYSYSYPSLADLNNDGKLECYFIKYNFPYANQYYYEVYNTNISTNGKEDILPIAFQLKQNFPNPFNPTTSLNYVLDKPSNVELKVYNINGELLKTLVQSNQSAGEYSITWNGTNEKNEIQPSGMYVYELKSDDRCIAKKMMLLK